MKIAFVGKGGAGKTTASTLFAQYQSKYQPTLAIDADINMHMAELLSGERPKTSTLISEKTPSEEIRTYLRGSNTRIESNAHFKKSTPPGNGSNLINITNKNDWFLNRYSQNIHENLSLVTVGTYSEEGIASSCYHNNLAILENVLSHTLDQGVSVADMVAGTDAFASTLFSQFDMLVFVVEPTTRSLAVLEQYTQLAGASGVADKLFVIANKIENEDDLQFVTSKVEAGKLVGHISRSPHLLKVDKGQEILNVDSLSSKDKAVFEQLTALLKKYSTPMQTRLEDLWKLHKIYINQGFVKDRFGDLTTQIDPTFIYPKE
jgi:CO dehydrogenase maturation factor